MKKLNSLLFIATLLLGFSLNSYMYSQEINIKDIKSHIERLASEEFQGRKPGEPGGDSTAGYIREQFKKIGLLPMGENYYQYFDVVKDIIATQKNTFTYKEINGKLRQDFSPLSFTKDGEQTGKAVFAGYGFDINEDSLKWNDYAYIDVTGKWVILLLGDPEMDKSDNKFSKYSEPRIKALTAKEKGAGGVIFVSGMALNKKDELLSLFYDKSDVRSDIPVINITRAVANDILLSKNIKIESIEKKLNETMQPESFELPVKISAQTEIIQTKVKTENVIGMIPAKSDEFIIIGAHYDHLGMGGQSSGSRKPDTIAVHHGADDNASGVAGIIELAKKLQKNSKKLKRNVIFIAFSAEEMGLLGSMNFIKNPPIDLKKINAMFNFDMLGRLKNDNTLIAGGSGTSVEADSLLDLNLKGQKLKLAKSKEGFGPSDHSSFYAANIPVFFFTTGAEENYHKPEDDIDKINYEGEKLILDYLYNLIFNITNNPKRLTFQEAGPKTRSSSGKYKVKLGFMPDFASTDKPGIGVGGVTKGSPAELGGIIKDDRIIAIEGKTVKDIYEYMARLSKLEPGQTITVDVLRDGTKMVLLIQL